MTILRLPPAADPVLSVIMVTYGSWDWPIRSLAVLEEHTLVPFEVICVDNASWDGTGELLEDLVDGVKLVRNRRNLGFAGAANQGAELARGRYLCFLNPDCLVTPGWFRPLRDALNRRGIAAAIPRFLDPDGTLQEAGSVVDSQGWTEQVGRGARPDDPAYLFPRVVDFGSGACLVIRRRTFLEAAGFDPVYYPAYCEDVDLAFRLAESGLRTVYEPRSSVIHAGSVSTDNITRDRLIERNRRRLMKRWAEQLADRPPLTELEENPGRVLALRDALAPDRVLFLPEADPERAKLAAGAAAAMASGWPDARVTLLGGANGALEDLLAAGVEVEDPPDVGSWLDSRRFHYSAVLGGGPELEATLKATQPQAESLTLEAALEGPIEALMASIGAGPPLD
ncbi:MAG: glycosyltransferase family 2 protein [Actinomycetota bacterium]